MTRHRSMINSDASDKLQEWLAGDYSPRNLSNLKESIAVLIGYGVDDFVKLKK